MLGEGGGDRIMRLEIGGVYRLFYIDVQLVRIVGYEAFFPKKNLDQLGTITFGLNCYYGNVENATSLGRLLGQSLVFEWRGHELTLVPVEARSEAAAMFREHDVTLVCNVHECRKITPRQRFLFEECAI